MGPRKEAPVPLVHRHALFGPRFFRHLARLVRIYWRSPDALMGLLLLAVTVALELGTVYGNVLLSDVQREIFDAFQDRDMSSFLQAIGVFVGVAGGFVLAATYRIYLRGALEIRWRRWVTEHFLERWISSQAYCHIELHKKATDNPDQRIQEDVREFVASALGLSLSLLSAIATLVSFAAILWSLSGEWAFELNGRDLKIPGLMMWVAIAFALIAIFVTHFVGRPLVGIQFDRQRYEADFRFSLARFRDNVEEVALAHGEQGELRNATQRFGAVVTNWWQLIRAQRNLTLFTSGIGQVNSLVPLLIAAPAFFAGHIKLGSVMQTRIAYGEVSGALIWFVNAYQEIARWRANIERLVTLLDEIESTELMAKEGVRLVPSDDAKLHLDELHLEGPDGRCLVERADAVIAPGEHIALVGPSGCGKRMLLRAVAGMWRFGRGRIRIPAGARTLVLAERPYLPIGTLREALAYPDDPETYTEEKMLEVMRLAGLESLTGRLDESQHWAQLLSGGEQQRVGVARALLQEPAFLFLDEATSGLDDATVERVYQLLHEQLPHTGMVSIAYRPAVAKQHVQRWHMEPTERGGVLRAAA
jgi:putative ATP-binding cassette transporter